MDYCCEFDQGIAAEDGVVGVVDVYHIESYCFCSLGVPFAERDVQFDFAKGLDFLSAEADEGIL